MKHLRIKARYIRPGPIGRVLSCCVSLTDREEARLVGRRSVSYLLQGETDKMVTIERVSDDPYEVTTGLVPLSDVSLQEERALPSAFFDHDKRTITDAFREFALPLIDGSLSPVARIVRNWLG